MTPSAAARLDSIAGAFAAASRQSVPVADPDPLPETVSLTRNLTPDLKQQAALECARLLDAPCEQCFDEITVLAAGLIDAPMSLITVIDSTRQFFVSLYGIPGVLSKTREAPLSSSYCRHIVLRREPLVVRDATHNPVVSACGAWRDGFLAYLGVPIRDESGVVIAALSVADRRPREWTGRDLRILGGVSELLMTELQNRNAHRLLQQAEQSMRAAQSVGRASFNLPAVGQMHLEPETGNHLQMNDAYCRITGRTREELLRLTILDLVDPQELGQVEPGLIDFLDGQSPQFLGEMAILSPDGKARVRIAAAMIRDADGRPLHTIGTLECLDAPGGRQPVR